MTREVWHAPNIPQKKKKEKKKFKSSPPSPLPHLIPSHPQKEKKWAFGVDVAPPHWLRIISILSCVWSPYLTYGNGWAISYGQAI
jgi:hypothetical protein